LNKDSVDFPGQEYDPVKDYRPLGKNGFAENQQ